MNIAHIATSGPGVMSLVAPLHGFYRWLVDGSSTAARPMQRNDLRQFDSRLRPTDVNFSANFNTNFNTKLNPNFSVNTKPPSLRSAAPALRVVRVLDHKQPRASAGRMVISGRMADVCAELDRLTGAMH